MYIEELQRTKRLRQEKVDAVFLKQFGERYREYRKLWNSSGRSFLPDFPIHLDFEIVDACNLRCQYCFRNKHLADEMGIDINTGAFLPMETFKKVMEEGCKNGIMAVNFGFSGECLLNPNLIKMIHIAKDSGVLDIRLISNGTLITRAMADRLLESQLTFLSFSIDAGSPGTYKVLKGKDYFDKLYDIVKYTFRKKAESKRDFPLIRASFYSSPENKMEEKAFLDKFQDYVDFIDFQTFYDVRKPKSLDIKAECKAPFQRLAIFANGDVSPCCTFFSKKLITGNINSMTLGEIWKSEATQKIRDALINGYPAGICKECLQSIG